MYTQKFIMNILITAPSLYPKRNVSGVSSLVNAIIEYNKVHQYYHYLLGRADRPLNKINLLINLLAPLIKFPFFVRKNKIDIVHQNLPFNLKGVLREFIINSWCRLLKVPVVLHIHGGIFLMEGTSNFFYKYLAKSILQRSKEVIILSELENTALRNNFNYSKGLVLSNSVDTNLYTPSSNKKQGLKRTILFLGRIHESKGINDILEAFRLLNSELSFRFVLCGEGPMRIWFEQECENLLGNDFQYLGIVSGKEKIKVINDADIFILPSRYGEGLPMALLETMSAGLIPIVTDDASMKYVVQHQINGIRVKKNNPVDLSFKIKELLLNNSLFENLSKNAVESIRLNYGIENYIIELNKIYNLVVKK